MFGPRPVAYMTRSAEISWPISVKTRIALARVLLDAGDLGAGVDFDAAAAHLLRQRDAQIVVEAVQQFLARG